jgi:predicted PurR-regulated permease PerM
MTQLPLTVRRAIELMGLYFLGMIILVGKDIITPIVMAFFLAIMLLPIYRFFRKRKLPESLAIFLAVFSLIIIVGLLVWFFSSQISNLISDFPQIKANVQLHLNTLSKWIDAKTKLSTEKQAQLINEQNDKLLNYAAGILSGAASSVTGILIFLGLLPIYIFLLLYYKDILIRFIYYWFPENQHSKVGEVITESEAIIKSYLIGLLIQISYITILLGGILLLIGIKHAILIGAIFAILNLIPYIGALFGNIIGVLLTISSSQEIWPIFAVLGTIAVVQFLDNNILMPRIVGSKVKINALITIIGVFVAGALAGVSGMFLSLPIIAVLKIVFDRTSEFKQWGLLFGDDRSQANSMKWPVLKRLPKNVKKP